MPPGSGWASNSVHAWPFWSRYQAAARPAGPAPTMAADLPVAGARGGGTVAIGRVAMQRADGQALVEVAAPARLFAEARADAPQRAGQRQVTANRLHGLARVPGGDALGCEGMDELRDIQTGRALGRTGRNTLAGMVA